MTNNPALPTEAPVTTAAIEQMLRTALHDLVTVDMVRPLVNAAVEQRFEFTRQQISSIDSAQRMSFEQFNSAANRMQSAADTFQNTARTVSEGMGGLKATDSAQAKQIEGIQQTLEEFRGWMQNIEGRLNKTENQQASLHMDIHGSPTETNRENVFTAIGRLSAKIDDKFTAVNARLDKMEEKLEIHDEYIARRKAFEAFVWKQLTTIWGNKLYRYSLFVLGGSILGILGLNTPAGIDFLTHLIKALAGK